MTLKFESEILFDLMKRDGDDAPSDVLPYESELKEKYLNQVVGAYPKLQDYRPEWLNYNLYHHLPSDFPTESVTNVTSASFHDVVPYAYKSAILKGNTLVNLADYSHSISSHFTKQSNGHWSISVENNSENLILRIPLNQPLKDNTLYTVMVDITKNNLSNNLILFNGYTIGKSVTVPLGYIGKLKLSFTTNSSAAKGWNEHLQTVVTNGTTGEIELGDYILLEGDYTNIDIPYFEGMQSVKMPVLTTTGKNLFDVESSKKGFYWSSTETQYDDTDGDSYLSEKYIPVMEGDILIANNLAGSIQYMEYDSNKNFMKRSIGVVNTPYTVPSGVSFLRVSFYRTGIGSNCQLEKGTKSTPFEPYKTNILTVNEDVELRKVGNVQDELNLLTGELTQRIGEVVLDGSETWRNDGALIFIRNTDFPIKQPAHLTNGKLIKDSDVQVNIGNDYMMFIRQDALPENIKQDNDTNTLSNWKAYLQQNPITVQYQLATESIKTVDLTCINEQGESETLRPIEGTMHVNTSSQTLLPLLDMSVPVEATSQNLMSFANIVEEEK